MARGRHYAKLSLSNAARLSFSDLCILLFMFLSLCRLCVCVFLCSHWSLVDVPLIFFCPADHVPDWQPRVLLGMVEARSVNVKKTTTTTDVPLIFFCPADHVPDWQPRVLLGMVEARSVNVKKTTTINDPLSLATDSGYVFFFIILYIKNRLGPVLTMFGKSISENKK